MIEQITPRGVHIWEFDASWRGGGCPTLRGIEEEEVVSLQSQASGRHPLALELEHDHPSFRVLLDAGDPQRQILNLHWPQSLSAV
jgi:hypothetical protein